MAKRRKDVDMPSIVDLEDTRNAKITVEEINITASSPYYYNRMQKKYPDTLHSQMLLNLTHEIFSEEKAKELWDLIVSHLQQVNLKLQRNVGISVATMDYLTNINTTLVSPVLIDEENSTKILSDSAKDGLTNLYTRKFFDCALKQEVATWHREGKPICLMMIDIDDFKDINDAYGHQVGDNVIAEIAKIIDENTRDADIVSRYGGDEFAIIMPNCPLAETRQAAERTRKSIEDASILKNEKITVSIGLNEIISATPTPYQLTYGADIALYEAKENGKNNISIYNKENNSI